MADISSLTNLQAGDPIDWEGYADAKEAAPPPRKGRYVVRAPEKFAFGSTQQGYLSAQIDPIIVGPSSEGYEIRYVKVSAKPFKRGAATVSQLGDYLRAAQSTARPRSPQEQADAVEATANRTYQIDGDWEGYCKQCKYTAKGEAAFPKGADGQPQPWLPCPNECKDDAGSPVQLRARFRVERFVAAG
jgi:hypothetical protein